MIGVDETGGVRLSGSEVRALSVHQRAEMWGDPDWRRSLYDHAMRIIDDEGVSEGDCYVIDRAHDRAGYPVIKYTGVQITLAQAVALPPPGYVSRHLCGNSACVNPCHIAPGTYAENQADRKRHGTAGIGEQNSQAKLADGDVIAIRRSCASARELAERLGVTPDAVRKARTGKSHRHLNQIAPPVSLALARRQCLPSPSYNGDAEALEKFNLRAAEDWIEKHCIEQPDGCTVRRDAGKPPVLYVHGRGFRVAAILLGCDARDVAHTCGNAACVNIAHLRVRQC